MITTADAEMREEVARRIEEYHADLIAANAARPPIRRTDWEQVRHQGYLEGLAWAATVVRELRTRAELEAEAES